MGLLFLLFAYFQINDPDPLAWVAIYTAVAIVAIWAMFAKVPQLVPLAGIVVCIVWTIALLPEFINWLQMGAPSITTAMKAEEPHIEYTREFLGLLICGISFTFLYFQSGKET